MRRRVQAKLSGCRHNAAGMEGETGLGMGRVFASGVRLWFLCRFVSLPANFRDPGFRDVVRQTSDMYGSLVAQSWGSRWSLVFGCIEKEAESRSSSSKEKKNQMQRAGARPQTRFLHRHHHQPEELRFSPPS